MLKEGNKLWLMESNMIGDDRNNIYVESKAQGYARIRKIIKEYEKTLL